LAGMSMFSSADTTGEMSKLAVMSMAKMCFFMEGEREGGPIERLYFAWLLELMIRLAP